MSHPYKATTEHPTDPYAVPCPDCGLVFNCEFSMLLHVTLDHLPQPRAFIDLTIATSDERSNQ